MHAGWWGLRGYGFRNILRKICFDSSHDIIANFFLVHCNTYFKIRVVVLYFNIVINNSISYPVFKTSLKWRTMEAANDKPQALVTDTLGAVTALTTLIGTTGAYGGSSTGCAKRHNCTDLLGCPWRTISPAPRCLPRPLTQPQRMADRKTRPLTHNSNNSGPSMCSRWPVPRIRLNPATPTLRSAKGDQSCCLGSTC